MNNSCAIVTPGQKDLTPEQLMSRIKLLEDISHSMAHNIRGAASGIRMMNEMLIEKRKVAQGGEDEYPDITEEEIVDCINKSSISLLATLDSMMELVNQDLRKDLKYSICDVKQVSQHVVGQLYSTVVKKRATIVYNLTLKKIKYAKTYLESLLYNLVSNSLKYCKPDVPPMVTISSRMDNDKQIIEVQDNGLGIDLDKYGNKIFKLNQIFHKGFDSKGVGLFITKGQIESLGGHIAVESEVNLGTKFIVTL